MSPEEFLAALVAVHKYLKDKKEMPNEVVRGVSYWKAVARIRGLP